MSTENKLISIDGHKKTNDDDYREQCEKMYHWFAQEKEELLANNSQEILNGDIAKTTARDIAQTLMNLRQAEQWFYGEAVDETGKLPSGKKNTERR